ncbi:MAG TPA: hypothetical protein VMU47_21150 [Caldimonas sp.]|nr:hypothetical protein [Caldimonas sp.]
MRRQTDLSAGQAPALHDRTARIGLGDGVGIFDRADAVRLGDARDRLALRARSMEGIRGRLQGRRRHGVVRWVMNF